MIHKSLPDLEIEDLREYLDSWQIDSITNSTIQERLSLSLKRIHRTLKYLPDTTGKVLQIGASPFFLSSLLTRFGDYELALVDFADRSYIDPGSSLEVTINDRHLGEELKLTYQAFDIEVEPFPFAGEEFDGVIMCDVLQRTTRDPVAILSEIHRILKQGGWLLISTPNAAYYGNLLRIWMAQNPYPLYSTQTLLDRDNRPFTIPEITDLFIDLNGLVIERLEAHPVGNEQPSDWRMRATRFLTHFIKRNRLNEEHIFCRSRKMGEFFPARPQWLYKTYAPFYPQLTRPLKRSIVKLPKKPAGPSRFPRRICKLCDELDWFGEDWLSYLDQMGEPYHQGNYHRKAWEWAQGLYVLDMLGLINEEANALAVGAGTEQVLFYLANRIKMVTATDIYGQGRFVGKTAHAGMLAEPERYAKIRYRKSHLTTMYMDGTDLDFSDDQFDFAFSFSSIEHFGGHNQAAEAVREMGRVVKPGGAVIVTTEVILNGVPFIDHFQPDELLTYLVDGNDMNLIEELDFSLSDQTLANPVDFSHPGHDLVYPHVICQLGGVYWTSVCLAFQKSSNG